MTAAKPQEGLDSEVKDAVVQSMTQLLASIQTARTPDDTAFGKNLFKPPPTTTTTTTTAGYAGQGHCRKGGQGQVEVTKGADQSHGSSNEVEGKSTDDAGATALHLAARYV